MLFEYLSVEPLACRIGSRALQDFQGPSTASNLFLQLSEALGSAEGMLLLPCGMSYKIAATDWVLHSITGWVRVAGYFGMAAAKAEISETHTSC